MRERDIKKVFYFNEKENKRFKKNVLKSSLSESNYLRSLIMNYEPKKLPSEKVLSEIIDELKPVGKLLNEVAREANRFDFINVRYYRRAIEKLNEIEYKVEKQLLNRM